MPGSRFYDFQLKYDYILYAWKVVLELITYFIHFKEETHHEENY